MDGDTRAYLASNRRLWDEWARIHAASEWYAVDAIRRGECKLRDYELDEVGDVTGRTLLHLQCQIGTDTICWARRGAAVTGVDFSPEAITVANELAQELDIEARFVRSDVLTLPDELDGVFDVVYTSRGVMGWLPDLDRWAAVAAQFLAPGGTFYVTDIHPIFKTLRDDADEPRIGRPYFPRAKPLTLPVEGSYADPSASVNSQVKHLWPHSVAEIITSVAQAGLCIEFFHEFPWADRPLPFLEPAGDRRWALHVTHQSQKGGSSS